jgi:site-specific DNA-methyltransferase (adenine-specific)
MMNDILNGDCLQIMDKIEKNSIDLVYLDPPFFTQRTHKQKTRDNRAEFSFTDTWNSREEYCQYISLRLRKCKSVLKDSGSIFLHCDTNASHVLRIEMEKIFGAENFRSEIIWCYKRWSNSKKGLLDGHQTILFFSKTEHFKFNFIYQNYSHSTNVDQIVQKRTRNEHGKSSYQRNLNGNIELMDEKKGVPLSDVWDIPYLNPKAKERVGYPTQKPVNLLERIITIATNEEDTVLDPFCGSGTTLVAAKLLKRNFIGIDKETDAYLLSQSRILNPIKSESKLLNAGRDSYKNQDPHVSELMNKIGAVIVQRNKNIDGLLKTKEGLLPVRVLRQTENISAVAESLEKAIGKNGHKKALILTYEASVNQNFSEKIKISSTENFMNG